MLDEDSGCWLQLCIEGYSVQTKIIPN